MHIPSDCQMQFVRLEFTLHTLLVARSSKPPASFAVVKSNILLIRVCMKFEYIITKLPYLGTNIYECIINNYTFIIFFYIDYPRILRCFLNVCYIMCLLLFLLIFNGVNLD